MYHFCCLVVTVFFFSYLSTLPPTFLWRDTPEFANVAFTLSIAHPAGFPTYALLLKTLTYFPVGNVAFKANLAAAIFSLLSVILLFTSGRLFIKRAYPSASTVDIQISATAASLLFALGPIVWHNATIAEVYTLNTLFLAGLFYIALRWLDGFDRRWLYLGTFVYGLSAGNHATVALFLPGFLALYFFNRPERNFCECLRLIFFFLVGFSVYLYLPVRSLANPPYDWGDPQSLKNFLYQITDQKDFVADLVFPKSGTTSPFYVIFNHLSLMTTQFSSVGALLILFGIIVAAKRESGLSLTFLWITFSNHIFFRTWTSGDAFIPSYFALAFFLGVGTCILLDIARKWSRVTASRVKQLVLIGLTGLIAVHVFFTYPKVNKRDYYLPSDFYRSAFTGLDPEAILFTELQWFHLKYFQDIERMREDITVIIPQEILNPRNIHSLTRERHPRLLIPATDQGADTEPSFLSQVLASNVSVGRSIYWDLAHDLFASIKRNVQPHQDLLFRFSEEPVRPFKPGQWDTHFEKLWETMLRAIRTNQGLRDRDLPIYLGVYMRFLLPYLHAYQQPVRETLTLMRLYMYLYGPEGDNTLDEKRISLLFNSIGLHELHRGETLNGVRSLELAIQYDPQNANAYLNLALWSLEKAPGRLENVLERARRNGLNTKEICVSLVDYLFKEKLMNQGKQALALCRG